MEVKVIESDKSFTDITRYSSTLVGFMGAQKKSKALKELSKKRQE